MSTKKTDTGTELPKNFEKRGNKIVYRQRDAFEIEGKNPDFHYRFINTANDRKVEKHLANGYVFVDKTTGTPPELANEDKGPQARRALGSGTEFRELKLAAIPKELHEAMREETLQRQKDQMAVVMRNMEKNVPGLNGTINIKKG